MGYFEAGDASTPMVHLSYFHISSYPYHFLSPPCNQSLVNHHSHMPTHIFLFTPPCIYPFLSLDFHTILTTTSILTFVQHSCFVPTIFTLACALLSASLLKMKSLKATQTVPLVTRDITHSTRGRILFGQHSTFSRYFTSGT